MAGGVAVVDDAPQDAPLEAAVDDAQQPDAPPGEFGRLMPTALGSGSVELQRRRLFRRLEVLRKQNYQAYLKPKRNYVS